MSLSESNITQLIIPKAIVDQLYHFSKKNRKNATLFADTRSLLRLCLRFDFGDFPPFLFYKIPVKLGNKIMHTFKDSLAVFTR